MIMTYIFVSALLGTIIGNAFVLILTGCVGLAIQSYERIQKRRSWERFKKDFEKQFGDMDKVSQEFQLNTVRMLCAKSWSKNHERCLKCKKTDSPHHGNGKCRKCYRKVYIRPSRRKS